MRTLESRDDALHACEFESGSQSLVVVSGEHLSSSLLVEVAVYRSCARVVEAGGDGVWLDDLSVLCLHELDAAAVENAH